MIFEAAKTNKARPFDEKREIIRMMYTGTLIEDLIASVERAEAAQYGEPRAADALVTDGWLAAVQENADYDSKLPLWQESGVA